MSRSETDWPNEPIQTRKRDDGVTLAAVRFDGRCNGYARFPNKPVLEEGYNGLLVYVPVHGGITYADWGTEGSFVYGFDQHHAGDEERTESNDPAWTLGEADRMATAIIAAAEIEEEYNRLDGDNNEARAELLDAYYERMRVEHGIEADLGFGAMINILCGRL